MTLSIGDEAPDFTSRDLNGNPVSLSSFRGQKVALYFYPKDNTETCTKQACNLRDNYEALLKAGFIVIGVSSDTEKSHQKFIKKYSLPFPLIADPDLSINHLYGVWVEKQMYGRTFMGTARTTFVIDEKGIITNIISKVVSADHANQILSASASGQ